MPSSRHPSKHKTILFLFINSFLIILKIHGFTLPSSIPSRTLLPTRWKASRNNTPFSVGGGQQWNHLKTSFQMSNSEGNDDGDVVSSSSTWTPKLRQQMSALSIFGMVETAYLTLTKWTSNNVLFCGEDGVGCEDVLNGPYAAIHLENGVDIPLSALGFLAYASVTLLLLGKDTKFTRQSLLFVTTSMATFSSFLLSLILFVLRDFCPYCLLSAFLSLTLALLTYINDIPADKKFGATGASLTTIASLFFFFSIPNPALLASEPPEGGYSPPTITTTSTERSLTVAKSLQELDARFFGAYWCSHCYDQKQTLGKEAMENYIPYVECDRDGKNSRRELCKEKQVPGYPTWEVRGRLFPGEQSLEELEELVKRVENGD